MSESINKAQILGHLGEDPRRQEFQNGGAVVNFSVATSEVWREGGERKARTEWHRVAIFNEVLGKTAMAYLRKGSRVYVEGQMRSRTYKDRDGHERRVTELVVPKFLGDLKLMDPRQQKEGQQDAADRPASGKDRAAGEPPPLDDEVPF